MISQNISSFKDNPEFIFTTSSVSKTLLIDPHSGKVLQTHLINPKEDSKQLVTNEDMMTIIIKENELQCFKINEKLIWTLRVTEVSALGEVSLETDNGLTNYNPLTQNSMVESLFNTKQEFQENFREYLHELEGKNPDIIRNIADRSCTSSELIELEAGFAKWVEERENNTSLPILRSFLIGLVCLLSYFIYAIIKRIKEVKLQVSYGNRLTQQNMSNIRFVNFPNHVTKREFVEVHKNITDDAKQVDRIKSLITNGNYNRTNNTLFINRRFYNSSNNQLPSGEEASFSHLSSSHSLIKKDVSSKEVETFSANCSVLEEGRFLRNFDKIEAIGEGGFGIVFKAEHRLDQKYYAVKVIEVKVDKISSLPEHEVIKEAKTMIKFNSSYFVRYCTCWFESRDSFDLNVKLSDHTAVSEMAKSFRLNSVNSDVLSDESLIKNGADIWDESVKESERIDDSVNLSPKRISTKSLHNVIGTFKTIYFFMQMEFCDGTTLKTLIEQKQSIDGQNACFIFLQLVKAVVEMHSNKIIHRDLKCKDN